jgi:hypothetical protein
MGWRGRGSVAWGRELRVWQNFIPLIFNVVATICGKSGDLCFTCAHVAAMVGASEARKAANTKTKKRNEN